MRDGLLAGVALLMTLDAGRLEAQRCAGDCGDDGEVTVNELVRAVSVALGLAAADGCAAADINGDGTVTVSELIGAVNSVLTGCGGASATPTRTPTSIPNATQTPGGPCSNGQVSFSYSNVSADSNAVTSDLSLTLLAGSQIRDPRSGLYVWTLTALECTQGIAFHRSIQLQIVGVDSPFAAGKSVDLGTPTSFPLDLVVYGELQDPNTFLRTWTPSAGSLTITRVDGTRVAFTVEADMVPYPLNSFGDQPEGTFHLEVQGEITDVTSQ